MDPMVISVYHEYTQNVFAIIWQMASLLCAWIARSGKDKKFQDLKPSIQPKASNLSMLHEPRKIPALLSIESWLVNRDPCNGLKFIIIPI